MLVCDFPIICVAKSGYIKEDLFFELLKLHGVDLSDEARSLINATYKKADKINYSEAMPVICIDIETAVISQDKKWTVRTQ